MPVTRSVTQGKRELYQVATENPATPTEEDPEPTDTTAPGTSAAEAVSTDAAATTTTQRRMVSTEQSAKDSKQSTAATITLQRVELQAPSEIVCKQSTKRSCKEKRRADRIAKAKMNEEVIRLKLELTLAKQAALEVAQSSEDSDRPEPSEYSAASSIARVGDWVKDVELNRMHTADKQAVPVDSYQNFQRTDTGIIEQQKQAGFPPCSQSPAGACGQYNFSEFTSAITLAIKSAQRPKITELPIFSGSHQDWLPFRATYYETESLYSAVENTIRLRRNLKGIAKEAVQGLLITNTNPADIMKALETRFGRPESIAMAEVESLKSLPRLTESPRDICIFSNKLTNVVATLRTLNCVYYLYNPEVTKLMLEKLTPTLRYRYYDFAAAQPKEEPDLLRFDRYMRREAEVCGPYAQPEQVNSSAQFRQRTQRVHKITEEFTTKCPVCNEAAHTAPSCDKFKNADEDTRWDMAKQYRLCFRCLRYKSKTHHCKAQTCGIDNCKYFHNRMLHFVRKPESENNRPASNVNTTRTDTETGIQKQSDVINSAWTSSAERQSFLKIIPVRVSGPAGALDTFALLDDGSTITLIDSSIADHIDAQGPVEPIRINAINQLKTTENESRKVTIIIKGLNNHEEQIKARTMNNLLVSTQQISRDLVEGCDHLRDISDVLAYKNAKPKLLIGQDNWHLLLATEVRKGNRNQPVASLTPLGWVLHGAQTRTLGRRVHFVHHIAKSLPENDLEEMMKQYFAMDALCLNPNKPKSDPEQQALRILKEKTTRTEEGRYQTALLWRNTDTTFPNNYENTLKRLYGVERKLDRDPLLKKKYTEQMESLITKRYAEPAPVERTENKTWYLPHFAVLNPTKPGKLRVVHDAAAKTKGVSLNDMLLKGPELLQSLPGVVMRFRQHRIAVTADIAEMFMQVKLRTEDRDALRYLWRGDRRDDQPPDEYRMSSLIFGAACSPSAALYVKDLNAMRYETTHPEAASAIIRKHYVDDYLDSFKTLEYAIKVTSEVRDIHREACFELKQWKSNSPQLLKALGELNETNNVELYHTGETTERVLGIIWNPNADELTFNLNLVRILTLLEGEKTPTKREALRTVMSLFDPLGMASPVTIQAKQILQEVWRQGTSWDDELEEEQANQWKSWLTHLKNLCKVTIPRRYLGYSDATSIQLHVFTDASELAYATVLYWRTVAPNGEINVSLILAKAKVAPLKLTSIPRLELQAAVMGARLAETVVEEHERKPDSKTFWTDSRTVLSWIKTGSRSYKPYVAHRLAAIEESSTTNEWRWLPSKLNVADDATRNVPPSFSKEHRWYKGPDFLNDHEDSWPREALPPTEPTGEEKVRHISSEKNHRIAEGLPDITRFSTWDRLRYATARVLQFISLCRNKKETVYYKRNKKNRSTDPDWKRQASVTPAKTKRRQKQIFIQRNKAFLPITAELLKLSEELLLRSSQEDSFPSEIDDIKNKKPMSNESRLRQLSIEYTDEALRLSSRIDATLGITEALKRPMVVDGNHHTVQLWIKAVHRQLHHAGVEMTVNECRQQYWILRLRPITRMLLRQCLYCRIKTEAPPYPRTGDLPECRLAHHKRPFTFTGLDLFGPLTVTVGRTHQKRYGVLFSCLSTRAIHVEIASSLTTDSAIMALRRMIAHRGCPSEIWSDNETNLKGADKELRQAINAATSEEAAKRSISWRFIPPGAPFMGGAWERMVRSVKVALAATLHERYPTDEVLATLLAEVEYSVNSRPLTHVSVSAEDPEALTPNHFLIGGQGRVPIPGSFNEKELISSTSWRAAQRLADVFWSRWMREFLPELQHRRQPYGRGPSVKIGDLVLLIDSNHPRNVWIRGRVTAVYPGPDDVVRTVDIKTKGGVLRRPVRKLIVLPIESGQIEDDPAPVKDASFTHGGRDVQDSFYS